MDNCKSPGRSTESAQTTNLDCFLTASFEVRENHLIGARWAPSPFHSPRPEWAQIELVVIHCISLPEGRYGTGAPERLFLGCLDCAEDESFADLEGVEVSSHLLIERTGDVAQFVTFDDQAWHAGQSLWCGRGGCNQFSIGIEMEGAVDDSYTPVQMQTLVEVLKALLVCYPGLSVNQIVGHQDIAPGRKYDPGPGFDWTYVLSRLVESATTAQAGYT